MKRDKTPLSPARLNLSSMPESIRECVRQLDVLGWPASALFQNFLATGDDRSEPIDTDSAPLAIIDRCLASWITHLGDVDRQETDQDVDTSWERLRTERRLALALLRELQRQLGTWPGRSG